MATRTETLPLRAIREQLYNSNLFGTERVRKLEGHGTAQCIPAGVPDGAGQPADQLIHSLRAARMSLSRACSEEARRPSALENMRRPQNSVHAPRCWQCTATARLDLSACHTHTRENEANRPSHPMHPSGSSLATTMGLPLKSVCDKLGRAASGSAADPHLTYRKHEPLSGEKEKRPPAPETCEGRRNPILHHGGVRGPR